MTRPVTYNTKQRKAIFDFIVSQTGAHVTAAQIAKYFENENAPIGRTTIYRHLDKLTESGKIRRYITDGISGACYQYVDDKAPCDSHIHLKCESCGELLHLECTKLYEIQKHVTDQHAFRVNSLKTVFYGICENCLQQKT